MIKRVQPINKCHSFILLNLPTVTCLYPYPPLQYCLLVLALASALVLETSALGSCPYCETSYNHCLDLFGCSNRISDSDRCYEYCFYRFEICETTTNCKPQAPPSLEEFENAINSWKPVLKNIIQIKIFI